MRYRVTVDIEKPSVAEGYFTQIYQQIVEDLTVSDVIKAANNFNETHIQVVHSKPEKFYTT